MTYALYTALLAAGVTAYAPLAVARRLTRGIPLNLRARLGYGAPEGGGPHGWVHAVSVGEVIAAAPLVEGLRRAYPALPLVVTTVTPTGARVVTERFAGLARHRYFPLDFPGAVRRTIDAIDPVFFICMETELWPNTLRALAARGVPTMIANGRLSDRSFRRYRLVRGALRSVLADVRVFAMRSDEDARRIIALGAAPERVVVTGNLKNDAPADPAGAADLWRRLLGLPAGQRVWIAGSTHRGEEATVLDAFLRARARCPDLALLLAPRHPERAAEVVDLVRERGLAPVRRSRLPEGRAPGAVVILDTVGELAGLYAIAEVVFVGGSLVPVGGHNVLEPAMRGKPVLYGPHTSNFREGALLLERSGGGLVVKDALELERELSRLLEDRDLARRVGDAARAAFAGRRGAVSATLDLIARHLWPGRGPAAGT